MAKDVKNGWMASIEAYQDYLKKRGKADHWADLYGRNLLGVERRRFQALFYELIRRQGQTQTCLKQLAHKSVSVSVQAFFSLAMVELVLESDSVRDAKIIHHAVEQSKALLSPGETKLLNALLRKVRTMHEQLSIVKGNDLEAFAYRMAHPEWLVAHWLRVWGKEKTEALLEWNNQPASIYLRSQSISSLPQDLWEDTNWPDMYRLKRVSDPDVLALLAFGKAYIQDPATRIPVGLIQWTGNERVLELCAAPGGKSRMILEHLNGERASWIGVDLPGPRFRRFQDNMKAFLKSDCYSIIAADVLELSAEDLPQPTFDVVFIDVPCSNTGVIQRRPDVRWRLREKDFQKLKALQWRLLKKAASFVDKGGHLIYSTCSIEPSENEVLVQEFMDQQQGMFTLSHSVVSFPPEVRHDGGGAFLLRRVSL